MQAKYMSVIIKYSNSYILYTLAGYMEHFCRVLRESLEKLPGDARTQLAVVTYDAASVHLYVLQTQSAAPAASANVERVPSGASTAASEQSSASATGAASATSTSTSTATSSQNGVAQSNSSHSQSGGSKRLFRMLVVTDIDDLWEDASTYEYIYRDFSLLHVSAI